MVVACGCCRCFLQVAVAGLCCRWLLVVSVAGCCCKRLWQMVVAGGCIPELQFQPDSSEVPQSYMELRSRHDKRHYSFERLHCHQYFLVTI